MNLPNILTIGRILITPLFIILLFYDHPYAKSWALFIFVAAMLTDIFDGYYARKYIFANTVKHNEKTPERRLSRRGFVFYTCWRSYIPVKCGLNCILQINTANRKGALATVYES